jgi:hypothetical protein
MEADRLELALRTIADQRHAAAVAPRHPARRQRGHGGRSQSGRESEFGEQDRVARIHLGKHAECGHGQQALRRVLRVTIHVLERIQPTVADRHQLDHSDGRMHRVSRRFVELIPPLVIRLDFPRQCLDERGRSGLSHEFADALDARVVHHGLLSSRPGPRARHRLLNGVDPPS